MNDIKRMLVRIILFIALLLLFTNQILASEKWPDGVLNEANAIANSNVDRSVENTVNIYMGNAAIITKIIAVTVAVIILIVLGMKYMIASPGEKADVKKSMVPYVIGAFIVFAAAEIVRIIISFSAQI